MGFRRPNVQVPSVQGNGTNFMDQVTGKVRGIGEGAITPRPPSRPSAINAAPYNPMMRPFEQFRMSPFLLMNRTRKAGRPSLVAGRRS